MFAEFFSFLFFQTPTNSSPCPTIPKAHLTSGGDSAGAADGSGIAAGGMTAEADEILSKYHTLNTGRCK